MRVIGIKILDGEKPVIKNLKPEGWYPFGDYQEPTETNVGLRQTPYCTLPEDFALLQLFVSAVKCWL